MVYSLFSLAIKAIMISFKAGQLDLIALNWNNVNTSNNKIIIVLIAKAKGTQCLSGSYTIP